MDTTEGDLYIGGISYSVFRLILQGIGDKLAHEQIATNFFRRIPSEWFASTTYKRYVFSCFIIWEYENGWYSANSGSEGGFSDPRENDSLPPEPIEVNPQEFVDVWTKLLDMLSPSIIKRYMELFPATYVKSFDINTLQTAGTLDNPIIKYSSYYWASLNDAGKLCVIFHEYAHFAHVANNMTNSHESFLNSLAYQQGIRDIFPGESEEFYDQMKWMGVTDNNVLSWAALDTEKQREIRRFLMRNLNK